MSELPNEPTTAAVAARLGVTPAELREFVDHHPDPEVEHLSALRNTGQPPLDEDSQQLLAEWLENNRRSRRSPSGEEILSYLQQHGESTRGEIVAAFGREWKREIRKQLHGLEKAGEVVRDYESVRAVKYRLAETQ